MQVCYKLDSKIISLPASGYKKEVFFLFLILLCLEIVKIKLEIWNVISIITNMPTFLSSFQNNFPADLTEDSSMEEVTRKFFEMCSNINCLTGEPNDAAAAADELTADPGEGDPTPNQEDISPAAAAAAVSPALEDILRILWEKHKTQRVSSALLRVARASKFGLKLFKVFFWNFRSLPHWVEKE